MLYNTNHRFGAVFDEISQEEISHCPAFFLATTEDILNHPQTPTTLKRLIQETPYRGDRKYTVHQVRINDASTGSFWHIDKEVPRIDRRHRVTESYDDLHLYITTFGNVCQTEFIKTPLEIRSFENIQAKNYNRFRRIVETLQFETHYPLNGQQVIYSSYDIHRTTPRKTQAGRMVVITMETDKIFPVQDRYFPVNHAAQPVPGENFGARQAAL